MTCYWKMSEKVDNALCGPRSSYESLHHYAISLASSIDMHQWLCLLRAPTCVHMYIPFANHSRTRIHMHLQNDAFVDCHSGVNQD
jgi:hypothetical protein